jgi:hypothetical protein
MALKKIVDERIGVLILESHSLKSIIASLVILKSNNSFPLNDAFMMLSG